MIETKKQIKKILNTIYSIILPNYCEVCGNIIYGNTNNICIDCINNKMPFIDKDNYNRCSKCFSILSDYNTCRCNNEILYYQKVSSLFYYEEPLIKLIHLMKFERRHTLCKEFGVLLSNYRKEYIKQNDYIIPIPLARKRLFKRGYNQSLLISNVISKKNNIEVLENAVVRNKDTKALSTINNITDRKNEILNAFTLNKKYVTIIKDKNILIIDDVFTTGSTSNEIAKVLIDNKAASVNVLTVSRV